MVRPDWRATFLPVEEAMKNRTRLLHFVLLVALVPLLAALAIGRQQPSPTSSLAAVFTKQDVMIPARDGVRLHTEIYIPKNASEPLPFLITRTPYGLNDDEQGFSRLLGLYREMIPDGYIFVFQDIRGRYGSEGQFVMQRMPCEPPRPGCIDEGTDTYDTIEWLLKNVPGNNGGAPPAPGAPGSLRTGLACRHVPRR